MRNKKICFSKQKFLSDLEITHDLLIFVPSQMYFFYRCRDVRSKKVFFIVEKATINEKSQEQFFLFKDHAKLYFTD